MKKVFLTSMFASFIRNVGISHFKGWLVVLGLMSCYSVHAEKVFYAHPDLHLWFTLDTETKEALVGRGEAEEHNALNYPPLDDEWWMNGQQNLWDSLVIPEILEYKEEEYKVVGIQRYAFYKTTAVRKISLPESIRTIGEYAFAWCTYLEEANIPVNVTEISSWAFQLCFKMKKFDLPKVLESIGSGAFSDCSLIEKIVIPASCKSIGNDAFTWCENLSSIIIEDGVDTLFLGHSFNLGIQYPGGGTYTQPVERGLFADCPIDTLYLGRNVKFPNPERSPFGRMVRMGYNNYGDAILTEDGQFFDLLQIGDLVTELSDGIFAEASIKNELRLPPNLRIIGDNAFKKAVEQIRIDLPKTLERIGQNALTGLNTNSGIRFVTCNSSTPIQIQNSSFNNAIVAYVPSGSASSYRANEVWGKYKIIDESDELLTINVKTEGSLYSRLLAQNLQTEDVIRLKLKGILNDEDWSVVKDMTNLYELDLSELALLDMPLNALEGKSSLVSLKLPTTITSIPENIFSGCLYLSDTIEIPASCKYIGKKAFSNTAIEGLVIKGDITIDEYAFWGNKALQSVELIGEETTIKYQAFWGTGVKSVTIGKGVKVEDEVFHYCNNLECVTFEDGVESIGNRTFDGDNLRRVIFKGAVENYGDSPLESVTEVHITDISKWCTQKFPSLECSPLYYAEHLFVNGEEITELVIPENVEKIEDYAFYNRKLLHKLTLPEGITAIGEYAFHGCSNIDSLLFPLSLNKIGGNAFNGCESLTRLEFPLSVDSIGYNAFSDCSNLVEIMTHWDNPFVISSNTFIGVSSECFLYVPILTASKYLNAGWNVPNMKEAGIIDISVNNGGFVAYNNEGIRSSGKYLFSPYKSFELDITADEGFSIRKVKLNGENVTSMVKNGKLLIEEPEENQMVSVVFADNSIPIGDSDGNKVVNTNDAMNVANHILKKNTESFIDYASDMNDDDKINVTDAIMIISKTKEEK